MGGLQLSNISHPDRFQNLQHNTTFPAVSQESDLSLQWFLALPGQTLAAVFSDPKQQGTFFKVLKVLSLKSPSPVFLSEIKHHLSFEKEMRIHNKITVIVGP